MKQLGNSLWLIALLTLIPLVACERQGPPKPVGTATNKHVEQLPAPPSRDAAEAMSGAMKSPLDKAQQTGEVVQGAADRTSKQAEQAELVNLNTKAFWSGCFI